MKLSEIMKHINTALNYPALTYVDINVFFDMAIAELNTTLHTSIPLIKTMEEEFRQNLSKYEDNKVILKTDPSLDNYIIPSTTDLETSAQNRVPFLYNPSTKTYFVLNQLDRTYKEFETLKAIFVTAAGISLFESMNYGADAAWYQIPTDPTHEAEVGDYLPDDWILLWLVPYVCFKYTVRDGGTAQTFAEELTQGFQQLQETYDIPSKVVLATYADKAAYTKLVKEHLPNLNIYVPTQAIYESMKHSRNTNAIYGNMYDRGGFL